MAYKATLKYTESSPWRIHYASYITYAQFNQVISEKSKIQLLF